MQIHGGNGELPVVLECDHGQTPMHMSWSGIAKVEDTQEYMMDRCDDDDEGESVFVIQAY